MSCACGHHAPATPDSSGTPLPLDPAPVGLHGRLICADAGQMMTVLTHLPGHVDLSRAEPGCLRFQIAQSDDPLIWTLDEIFADDAAFAAHQSRMLASEWGQASTGITRDFHRHPVEARIRPEISADHAALDDLLTRAFGGPAEALLLRALRRDGALAHGLTAHLQGQPVGYVALSHLTAERPALALAPVAVHPALQGRGIGLALIRAALAAADGLPVVVLGEPAYYARAGFRPADLISSHAGPALQIHGDLPQGSRISHAIAFAEI